MRVNGIGTSADAIEVVVCDIGSAPPRLELEVLAARAEPILLGLQQRIHAAATIEAATWRSSVCWMRRSPRH